MAKTKIKYAPLDYQLRFHQSQKPKVYLSAGLGAGKSHSLVMKMFALMNANIGLPGGLLCPTLKMAKRDVIPLIREICSQNRIIFKYNKSDSVLEFPQTNTIIYIFHGEDEGYSIRGPNLAFGLINEVTLIDKSTFDAFLGRIRLEKANLLQLAMSGSPEGFTWHYEYFIEKPRDDTELIFGDTRKNKYIAQSYVQTLYESYDELTAKQFVEGQFVNILGSRAVHRFDRFKHLNDKIEQIQFAPVWVSLDFNISPMSAVLWNPMGPDSKIKLQAFDEVCIEGRSDTFAMAKLLKQRLLDKEVEVTIYPDPAGNAGSTKSHYSDIDILRQHGFKNIKFKNRIASVQQCLNAVNNMFDKDQIRIHPKCKNFIADLEQVGIKSTGELDKSNPKRSHWLDGFKDMVDYEYAIAARGLSRSIA